MKNRDLQVLPPEQSVKFETAAPAARSMMEGVMSRQAQEVQAAMLIAKKFPRDENEAFTRIITACRRKSLAEKALYAYPRGGTTVSGPSIHLARAMARAWGNIDYGIIELEQHLGESTVMSYAWDLETNSRAVKVFTVRHERTKNDRQTGQKTTTILDDPRDIYEMVANQGARRLRACILDVIPGDVCDAAEEEVDKTLSGGNKAPLVDRVREMVLAFEPYGVTAKMIEARLGHKLEAVIEMEFVQLRKIYNSLRDGAAKREDFFDVVQKAKPESGEAAKTVPATPFGNAAAHESAESPANMAGPEAEKSAAKKTTKKQAEPPQDEKKAPHDQLRDKLAESKIEEHELIRVGIRNQWAAANTDPDNTELEKAFTDSTCQQFLKNWPMVIEEVEVLRGRAADA